MNSVNQLLQIIAPIKCTSNISLRMQFMKANKFLTPLGNVLNSFSVSYYGQVIPTNGQGKRVAAQLKYSRN